MENIENQLSPRRPQILLIDKRAIIESQSFALVCNQNDKQIKELLIFVFSLIGITGNNIPDKYQETIIISYIRNHLSKYTTQDFKIAFMLGIKGKLDFNIQSFQNFNPLYVENVMQSFNRYRFDIIRNKKTVEPKVDKEKLNKEATIKFIKKLYNGEACLDSIYVIVYDYLKANKKLLLTEKRKEEIAIQAKIIQNKLREVESIKQMKNVLFANEKLISIKKKIAVIEYFEKSKELGVTVDKIIEI